MPRFDDRFLDCSVYLYPTIDDARRGDRIGGCGFLACVPGPSIAGLIYVHPYVVSNRHVIEKSPVVRLNTHKGDTDVIPFSASNWTFTRHQDIAVVPIDTSYTHRYLFISTTAFLTEALAAEHDVGIGDEAFMVGRFVNHEGRQRNLPSIRWGHVSMMPYDPVYHSSNDGQEQESFLVEVHSISGYSGSPVFVRPSPTTKLPATVVSAPDCLLYEGSARHRELPENGGPWLLGVDWGYINNHHQRENNTGMSAVIPAWRVLELLNTEALMRQREDEDKELIERWTRGGTTLASQDERPGFTKQEFEEALKKASRKIPPAPSGPGPETTGT
jgi:hypothetical protein